MQIDEYDEACEQNISERYANFYDRWKALEDNDNNSKLNGAFDIRLVPDPTTVVPFKDRAEARTALAELIDEVRNSTPGSLRRREVLEANLQGCAISLDYLLDRTPLKPQAIAQAIIGVKPVSFRQSEIEATFATAADEWRKLCERYGVEEQYCDFTAENVKIVQEARLATPDRIDELCRHLDKEITYDMVGGTQDFPGFAIMTKADPTQLSLTGGTQTDSNGVPRLFLNSSANTSKDFGSAVITIGHERTHWQGLMELKRAIEEGKEPAYLARQAAVMPTYIIGEAPAESVSQQSAALHSLQMRYDPGTDFRLAYRALAFRVRANVLHMVWNDDIPGATEYYLKWLPDGREAQIKSRSTQVQAMVDDPLIAGVYHHGYSLAPAFQDTLERLPKDKGDQLLHLAASYSEMPADLLSGKAAERSIAF